MTLPIDSTIRVKAPATVANLGPGFDVLGLAVAEPGDVVMARLTADGGVVIRRISGDGGKLPTAASRNTAGIAAGAVLRLAGSDRGVELELEKGMPLGSGLGSSAASAAAAAAAVNLLLGAPLSDGDLVEACLEAEAAVSGRHADNVAPSLLGGLILVRSTDPLDLVRLPIPGGLMVVVVTPHFELPTRLAREALPDRVPLKDAVRNQANLAALVSAFHNGDVALLGRALDDVVVTPARLDLIPGCRQVITAALQAGALGSSISGAGPSVFALCSSAENTVPVSRSMQQRFSDAGLDSDVVISPADCPGAREL
jgi:homoserine kinase